MGIFFQVVQIHGMEWKKRKSREKEDVCKSTTLMDLKQIGKSNPKALG